MDLADWPWLTKRLVYEGFHNSNLLLDVELRGVALLAAILAFSTGHGDLASAYATGNLCSNCLCGSNQMVRERESYLAARFVRSKGSPYLVVEVLLPHTLLDSRYELVRRHASRTIHPVRLLLLR